ncbi:uncharacterized protein [Cardiocondyla obscurior]|uniref:uncharacterized protein n=1 Tax=Cardiocondyla obscurior TaxID=286306 RepID=UPI00396578C8
MLLGAKIPITAADIRIRGLEASIQINEVLSAAAEKGNCRLHEIKSGNITKFPGGIDSIWLRLPLAAAKKVVEGGTINICWTKVKVDLLRARSMRCFKCLEKGHAKERCPVSIDRSGRCYRCGKQGHAARGCSASPCCPLCSDIGRKADHIWDGQQCFTRNIKGKELDTKSHDKTTSLPTQKATISATVRSEDRTSPSV